MLPSDGRLFLERGDRVPSGELYDAFIMKVQKTRLASLTSDEFLLVFAFKHRVLEAVVCLL